MSSMPTKIAQNVEPNHQLANKHQSLPLGIESKSIDKENKSIETTSANAGETRESRKVDEKQKNEENLAGLTSLKNQNLSKQLGDSLFEMISNLKNENQKLAEALKTNEQFVEERIEEFKRATEEVKRSENQYATNKLEYKNQVRKLHHQNLVLNERLKNMETKLKDTKSNDNSGKSTILNVNNYDELATQKLYPELNDVEDIVQIDATIQELNVNNGSVETVEQGETHGRKLETSSMKEKDKTRSNARFSIDKLLKQCYQLERQLNRIEKRDLEISILQQKLSVLKGDLSSNSVDNFQANSQIESMRTEIENLSSQRKIMSKLEKIDNRRAVSGTNRDEVAAVDKLDYHLRKRAARSALKAAKYASKKAYREQKAAAIAAASNVVYNDENIPVSSSYHSHCNQQCQQRGADYIVEPHVGRRGHRHLHRYHSTPSQHQHLPSLRKLKSDLVGDIVSTANKAVLTGYKVASTHVNLALDKLSQFEQTQAQNLTKNQQNITQ